MRHIDEGTMHAYLDGAIDALVDAGALPRGTTRDTVAAHIAECADCRALLESERAIRARAGDILADSGAFDIHVPPFATLQTPARARRPRGVWPLAWAASVMLAVGAGWWGSELFRAQNGMSSAVFQDEAAPAPQQQSAPLETRAESPAANALRADLPAAPPAVGNSAARGGTGAALERAEAVAVDGSQARDAAAKTSTRTVSEPEVQRRDQRVAADSTRVGGGVAGFTRNLAQPAAPPPSVAALAASVAREANAQDFRAPSDAQFQRFRAGLDSIDAGRVALTAATPAALPDTPLLAIEAGETPVIQRGNTLGAVVTRVTQRVGDVSVEVVTWREAVNSLLDVAERARSAQVPGAQQLTQQAQGGAGAQIATAPQRKLGEAAAAYSVLSSTVLADRRQQVLLHWHDGNTLVAVRAAVAPEQLLSLVNRLTPMRRD